MNELNASLAVILDGLPLPAVALVTARTVALVTFSPVLGGTLVPAPVRVGLAGAFSLLLMPVIAETAPRLSMGPGFVVLLAKEVALGTLIGFLASLLFQAYSMAGRLIDTQRGANMAETLVFLTREQTSFLGQFLFQLAVLVVLLAGGHRLLLTLLAESFRLIPPGTLPGAGDAGLAVATLARLGGEALRLAFLLAAPAVLLLALLDLASGLVSRAAPQMNTFQTMQPARLLVGLWGLSISLPALASLAPGQWAEWVRAIHLLLRQVQA